MTDRTSLIDQLESFPARLAAIVGELDAATLTARPIPGEWSVAQNVHHVVDSHVNAYVRCKLVATETGPVLKPYDEAAWGELPDGDHADISGSLALLTHLHERWVRLLRGLDEETFSRTGYHPANANVVSIDDLLELYVGHGQAHVEQLTRVLDAL